MEDMYNDGAVQRELTAIPGFRFYPTEEELLGFYLKKCVQSGHQLNFDIIIPTLDLYRYDPWELPDLASDVGERQWFFFVPRDHKKCPRPNRLTKSGYWKATGADRAVRNKLLQCIGLKKILVFYKGKAPLGQRTDWIMNEYRMPDSNSSSHKKVDMVLSRIYRKASSQKSTEQRTSPDRFAKELVVSAVDEYEDKCNSIALNGNSCQSNSITDIKVSSSGDSEGSFFFCFKIDNEASPFECLENEASNVLLRNYGIGDV